MMTRTTVTSLGVLRTAVLLAWAGGLAGCLAEADLSESRSTVVVRTLAFGREGPEGVSVGMNLDGYASGDNDDRACRKVDFTGPAGEPGIDNELGRLLPLVDLAGENALQSLIQGAIDEGRLLVLLELIDHGDGTGELIAHRGLDRPLLGTDGLVLSGQTLALDPSPRLGRAAATISADGWVETERFELELPVIVFSLLYVVKMPRAVLRFHLAEDGTVRSGLIAGGIPVSQLIAILQQAGEFGGDFDGLFGDALRDSADLDRDATGHCQSTSVAVVFDAVPAFMFAQ